MTCARSPPHTLPTCSRLHWQKILLTNLHLLKALSKRRSNLKRDPKYRNIKMFVKRTSEHIRIVDCELWFMGLWIMIVIYRVTIRIRNLQLGFGSSLIFQILNPSQNENKILILQNTYIWIVDCDMIFIIPIRNTDLKHLVWQCLWYRERTGTSSTPSSTTRRANTSTAR